MTKNLKLKGRIVEKGFNMTTFSEKLGMSRATFRSRINGISDFKASEIGKICELLDIEKCDVESYFFTNDVPKMETSRS